MKRTPARTQWGYGDSAAHLHVPFQLEITLELQSAWKAQVEMKHGEGEALLGTKRGPNKTPSRWMSWVSFWEESETCLMLWTEREAEENRQHFTCFVVAAVNKCARWKERSTGVHLQKIFSFWQLVKHQQNEITLHFFSLLIAWAVISHIMRMNIDVASGTGLFRCSFKSPWIFFFFWRRSQIRCFQNPFGFISWIQLIKPSVGAYWLADYLRIHSSFTLIKKWFWVEFDVM